MELVQELKTGATTHRIMSGPMQWMVRCAGVAGRPQAGLQMKAPKCNGKQHKGLYE